MLRHLLTCILTLATVSATAQAGHHYHFPGYAFAAPPVMYAAPMVTYQPAYVVPTSYFAVQAYPVSTVTYSTQYYAPMVPMGPVSYSAYYAPQPVVTPGVYMPHGYYGRHGHYRRFRGVEVEFERDGDIEIDYRYR